MSSNGAFEAAISRYNLNRSDWSGHVNHRIWMGYSYANCSCPYALDGGFCEHVTSFWNQLKLDSAWNPILYPVGAWDEVTVYIPMNVSLVRAGLHRDAEDSPESEADDDPGGRYLSVELPDLMRAPDISPTGGAALGTGSKLHFVHQGGLRLDVDRTELLELLQEWLFTLTDHSSRIREVHEEVCPGKGVDPALESWASKDTPDGSAARYVELIYIITVGKCFSCAPVVGLDNAIYEFHPFISRRKARKVHAEWLTSRTAK